jgi:hypothetical protein
MIILTLGLDIGKHVGWFLLQDEKPVAWGTISSSHPDPVKRRAELVRLFAGDDDSDQPMTRPLSALDLIGTELGDRGKSFVAIESPRVDFGAHKRGNPAEIMRKSLDTLDLWRLAMRFANMAGRFADADLLLIEPEEGHRALTGSPKGDKAMCVKWANMRLVGTPGWEPLKVTPGNHLADAFGLALAGYAIASRLGTGIPHPAAV